MTSVWAAFRHAVRGLRRNPAPSVLIVLALSMGIGGTTAVFTVLEGVVLRPLPLPEPDQLFELQQTNPVGERVPVAMYEATELSARSRTVKDLAIATWDECHLESLSGTHDVFCASVGPAFFSILGLRLPLGRSFDKTDSDGANPSS